jgi:hypothetical protein
MPLPKKPMRTCYLDVTPQVIADILKGFQWPLNSKRRFMVTEHALPDDTVVCAVSYQPGVDVVRIHLASAHFPEDGVQLPPPHLAVVTT